MKNIVLKSKILKDILGHDIITDLKDLNKLFHESEAYEGLYESSVDLKGVEFSEQDMIALIDDINIFNDVDRDNIRCMKLVNFPDELKQRKIIYSILHPTLVEFENENEYNKQPKESDSLNITKELRQQIMPNFLQSNVSTGDIIEYITNFRPYIKPEDMELFNNYRNEIGPLNIMIENNSDAELLRNMLDKFSINNITLAIEDMSILPIDMISSISEMTNVNSVYIPGQKKDFIHTKMNRYEYSLENYIKLRSKIDKILEDVDSNSPEINRFLDIYRKLGESISYSWDEVTDEPSERNEAHSLIGPLLENECVCEGYALALKQVLRCSGLEAQYIEGNVDKDEMDPRRKNTSHAWNQVKIDGKWYNCDLTWDVGRIEARRELDYCLQSDEEFINHDINCEGREICMESYNRKIINNILKPTISRSEEKMQFEKFLNDLDQIGITENETNITSTQNLGKETINEQKDTLGKNEIGQEMAKHISELNNEHDITYYEG